MQLQQQVRSVTLPLLFDAVESISGNTAAVLLLVGPPGGGVGVVEAPAYRPGPVYQECSTPKTRRSRW